MGRVRVDSTSKIPPPLSVGARELARLLGVSRAHVYRLDGEGRLPRGIHLGGRKLWVVEEIRAWLRAGAPRRALWEREWESRR